MCGVGVFGCVLFGQHSFANTYLIKQYRHPLSTDFRIYPFGSPHRIFGIRRGLVNKTPIINWFLSTFCPSVGHHKRYEYPIETNHYASL